MEDALERIVLRAGRLEAMVMPALGGKIASLRFGGTELLQQPLRPYALRTMEMGFAESDASGFDECLPSVAACEIAVSGEKVQIPDHGEFWRLPCTVEEREEDALTLAATGSVLPLKFERRIALAGGGLRIDYRLKNVGTAEIPFVWSAHPLFSVDEGDGIVLPPSVRNVSVEGSAHERLGANGAVHSWPIVGVNGEKVDLSRCGGIADDIGDKLFASSPEEGWMAIERKNAGVWVRVSFDADVLPWCGLWLCYGGWPEDQAARQQCVALEPCTAQGDSLADEIAAGSARMLSPGEEVAWWMAIEVSEFELGKT